jgi:hypothetical protein
MIYRASAARLPQTGPHLEMQEVSELSRVEVEVSHSSLAFIYVFFTPTITINGERMRRPWGTHSFDLPPGNYEISVSYPWIFSRECGKNTVTFSLGPDETKRVAYCAGLIRYLPGKIRVS